MALYLHVTSESDLLTKHLVQLIWRKKYKVKKRSFLITHPLCAGILATQTQLFLNMAESALLVGLVRKALISFALCIVKVSGWL